MTDLSHWDFAGNFSGYDAAALILGIEPTEGSYEHYKISLVLARMKECYLASRRAFADAQRQSGSKAVFNEYLPSERLLSIGLAQRVEYPRDCTDIWLNDVRCFGFEMQEFSRAELARWLSTIGLKSVYEFNRNQSETISTPAARWPWGNHHTELLGHLEAAARRYWGENYDPSDASTAPINATVSEWLQTERKVSKTMADSIASLLRPDGLPTGPRK
jgi:hypothetical protein